MKRAFFLLVLLCLAVSAPLVPAQEAGQSEREVMYRRFQKFWDYVEGGVVKPHWLADGSNFWYAEGGPENRVIYKVDPEANTAAPLFDTQRVRSALERQLAHELPGEGLPFAEIRFVDDEERLVEFEVEDQQFRLELDSYAVSAAGAESGEETDTQSAQSDEKPSPDGRWVVSKKDHNLWLRSTPDSREIQLTHDGEEYLRWQVESWSPDGSYLVLGKCDWRSSRRSPYITWLGEQLEVKWRLTPKVGTPWNPEFYLFAVESMDLRPVEISDGPSQQLEFLGWTADGSEFLFGRVGRWYKKLEVLALDLATGTVRTVLTETSDTFLAHTFPRIPNWQRLFTRLDDGEQFIWSSERDGWRHLYLYRLDGTLVRRLTEGPSSVLRWGSVEVIDGWVYFLGHPEPDRPYDTHFLRVKLDGTGYSRLTQAPGYHQISRSPSKKFFVDTHSSDDRLPAVELRRSDGTLVRVLSRSKLRSGAELNWTPPEEIVVKAADGETDLYGVLFKPWNFDPAERYPVVEAIYNGPQTRYVAHSIGPAAGWWHAEAYQAQALAQLGFIVVMVDGRGTPERGKAFQDVVYRNFGRFEIADHAGVLRQLAAERQYMDLSRVGIYGASWGGYFTTRALLLAPDLYKVGVAAMPAHPTGWIHEPYLGPPDENQDLYEYARNETHIDRLEGKLLFITGTSDFWYPDLMRLLEAFVQAGKPYDLVLLPERYHNVGSVPGDAATEYYWEALRRYFQEHLKP